MKINRLIYKRRSTSFQCRLLAMIGVIIPMFVCYQLQDSWQPKSQQQPSKANNSPSMIMLANPVLKTDAQSLF